MQPSLTNQIKYCTTENAPLVMQQYGYIPETWFKPSLARLRLKMNAAQTTGKKAPTIRAPTWMRSADGTSKTTTKKSPRRGGLKSRSRPWSQTLANTSTTAVPCSRRQKKSTPGSSLANSAASSAPASSLRKTGISYGNIIRNLATYVRS